MKALILYNKFSGKSNASKKIEYLASSIKENYDVDFFESCGIDSIKNHIINHGMEYDLLIAFGGDGTFNNVINGMMALDNKPKLAYVPTGTCNDIGHSFNLKKNIKKSVKNILNGKTAKIDIYSINDSMYFVYGLAAGCLTEISYDAPHKKKRIVGRLAYYMEGIKAFKKTKPIKIKLESDGGNKEGVYSLFLALNTRYLAGFKIHRRKRILLNDGKIRLTFIKRTNKFMNTIDLGMFLIFGELYKHNIVHFNATDFKIESILPVAYNTDGEMYGKSKSVSVKCLNEAIEVILPDRIRRRHFIEK